jgi:hypothetical protein
MWIKRGRVRSYKSFLDSNDIELRPGFNVIVGQNNAGKTALAEALSVHFRNAPTVAQDGTPGDVSSVEMLVGLDGPALLTHLRSLEGGFRINLSAGDSAIPIPNGEHAARIARGVERLNEALQTSLPMQCRYEASPNGRPRQEPTRTHLECPPPGQWSGGIVGKVDHGKVVEVDNADGTAVSPAAERVCPSLRVYLLRAERSGVARSTNGLARSLHPDSSNLAEVLRNLQWSQMEAFNTLVRRVLPQTQRIEVQQIDQDGTLALRSYGGECTRTTASYQAPSWPLSCGCGTPGLGAPSNLKRVLKPLSVNGLKHMRGFRSTQATA